MRYDPYVNFTAGEISPQLRGRVDIDAYRHAATVMRNFQPLQYGGVRRRFGTEKIRNSESGTYRSRLIPFVAGPGVTAFLEFSHLTIRSCGTTDGKHEAAYSIAGAYTEATPYTEAQLREIRYAQSGNFIVFTHPEHQPRIISLSGTQWWFRKLELDPPPAGEYGTGLALAADVSVTAGIGAQTATATGATFLSGDVGRTIQRGQGFGRITSYTSTTQVGVDVLVNFNGATGNWFIGGQPKAGLSLAAIGSGGITEGEYVTVTATQAIFRAFNTGAYGDILLIHGGVITLTSFASATSVNGRVLRTPTSGAATTVFRLLQRTFGTEYPASTNLRGWPVSVGFVDQRMVFGAVRDLPTVFLGSAAGNVLDFTITGAPDDGYSWAIDGGEAIQHVAVDNDLLLLTHDAEYAAAGPDYGAVTGDSVKVRKQSTDGSGYVAPVKVGREHVFVQRNGRAVMALGFDIQIQGYQTHELTLLADHITESGIVEMAFARRPVPTLYCVRTDGKMACLTLDSKQRVTAWWMWQGQTDGNDLIESVAVVPQATYDEVWIVVRRFYGGVWTRSIERVQQSYQPPPSARVTGFLVDCGRNYYRTPAGATSVTITTHLTLALVHVVADGVYAGEFATNGSAQLTVPFEFSQLLVGLPYTSTLTPVPPEVPTQAGSGQGRSAQATEITVKLHQSIGGKINGAPITKTNAAGMEAERRLAAAVALPRDWTLDLVDTDVTLGAHGWQQAQSLVTITQEEPLPLHVLQIVQKIQANP
jgi:hypothetical protein